MSNDYIHDIYYIYIHTENIFNSKKSSLISYNNIFIDI